MSQFQVLRSAPGVTNGFILEGGRKDAAAITTPQMQGIAPGARASIWVEKIIFDLPVAGEGVQILDCNTSTAAVQGDRWAAQITARVDGDTLTINGNHEGWLPGYPNITFELDTNGSWSSANIPVDISGLTTNAQVATAVAAAINAANADRGTYCPFKAEVAAGLPDIVQIYSQHYYLWTTMLTEVGTSFTVGAGAPVGAPMDHIVMAFDSNGGQLEVPVQQWFHNGCGIFKTAATVGFSVQFRQAGRVRRRGSAKPPGVNTLL